MPPVLHTPSRPIRARVLCPNMWVASDEQAGVHNPGVFAGGGTEMHSRPMDAGRLVVVCMVAVAMLLVPTTAHGRTPKKDSDRDGLSNGFELKRSHTSVH